MVANTLQILGYEPVWQDIFGADEGDLRAVLREKIDACQGVVQIVGQCYGAEPPAPDEQFGRGSYTQYEALYARQRDKKVWYLVLDSAFPCDPHDAEPQELRDLQTAYRQRVQTDTHLFHELCNPDALKAKVYEIKDELARLRRGAKLWAAGVTTLLVVIAGLVTGVLFAVKAPPPPEPMTAQRAQAAFVAKNYPAAFDAYVRLSEAAPANISYHRRIEECARLGRLQKPFLDHYLALVQRQPGNALFHNYLGNACLLLDPRGADGKAQEQYEAALRLDPKSSLPLANLGILAYRSGKTNDAQALFQRYLAAYPDDAQGWVNLGMLCTARLDANTHDPQLAQEAEQAFRKALRLEPGLASAYKGLGRVLAAGGRKPDALNAYQRSLALNYDQPDVRQQIELLAWDSAGAPHPPLQSDDLTTRAIKGDATQAPLVVAAVRLLDQQRFPEAVQVCLEWSQHEPDNPLACHLLARAYDGDGQPEAALKARAAAERLLGTHAQTP